MGGALSVAESSAVAGALGLSYSGLSSVSHLGPDVGRSARQAACEQDYFGLKYDIYSFFTASENAEQKSRAKYSVAGEKRERSWEGAAEVADTDASALPLALYPWNQSLRVYPSLSLSMLGSILRITLTFCNREVLKQMTQVVFKQVEQEQTKMYNNFLEVAQADWAAALVMVPLFFASAMQTMRMVVGDARQRCALFPESKFFASVEQKRAGQAASLEQFTEAVLRRVSSEVAGAPAHARAECAVLMWAEFLGGWMPTSFSGQYCEETRRQWMSVRHGIPNDGGHVGRAQRLSHDGGSASPDGGSSGGGGGSGSAAQSNQGRSGATGGNGTQEFRRTIPCAIDIVGDTLGVASRTCASTASQMGVTIARRIAQSGGSRPGFRCQASCQMAPEIPVLGEGTRSRSKPQSRRGSRFYRSPLTFVSNGPMQAGVTGAPKLEDFQRRLAQAPAKP